MKTLAEIFEFVRSMLKDGRSKDEAFAWLDQKAAELPDLAPAIAFVKGFLEPLFLAGNIDEGFEAGVTEAMALLKNKFGPVSDAPEIGLS